MRSSAVVGIVLSWSAPSLTLSHLLAVVLMRSSAVVGIVLSWSAPSHTLSSTSCGAHALICSRGHRPLVVCTLTHSLIYQLWCLCAHLLSWTSSSHGLLPPTHSLIYQLWCSCAHLLSWASSSRGLLPPPRSSSSTSSGAHALICCREYPPLEVCSPPPHSLIY